jgi:ABC transport system ATP-binding/permease protein
MVSLTVRSLQKDFGIKEIVREANFSLEDGDKVGLIGTNGSGKSTLLKMIAGLEPIDRGEIQTTSGSTIVYLPQQPDLDETSTVLDQVLAAHDRTTDWQLETNAKVILSKLGVPDLAAKIADLSGGYRKRIAIATALLAEPDILLMDEPTNHLDALSVEWLQGYLKRFRGSLLLITHDRYFLDRVTNRILELDRGDLYSYSGNYSYYLEKKALAEESAVSSQRKHAGVLRRELEWLKRGPKARSTKQKARIDRIHDMQNQEFKQAQGKVDISTVGRRIGKKVIELKQVCKAYGDRVLLHDFSYNLNPEDRIGIIGPNGVGKSTLMDLITGRNQPDAGTIEVGSTIHIGYFDQHSEDVLLNENQRVIEYLKSIAELVKTNDGSVITASQMLERFLFPPDQQYAPIHKLSGGEKRRLFLLRVLMSAPNVLILDEPTNDLDVQTLAVLEDYLEDFNGAVIVVSHDRYFLDRTIDKIFAFEPGAVLRQYPGNYSVYLDYQTTAEKAEVKASAKTSAKADPKATAEPPAPTTTSAKPKKLSFKENREYQQLEAQIPQLEAEKAALEAALYNPAPNGYIDFTAMTTKLAELNDAIDQATERWLELAERAE